jgi:lipopolysaccharide/colanic/teichoic acid biosynthesis glycosyltransferase
MDKAVEYTQKLEQFVKALNTQNPGVTGDSWQVETGRKFDKVYVQTSVQKLGRYMVDRNSWVIYGIKSWAQINPRRTFGTLDTVNQYDWSGYNGVPKVGTPAEKAHVEAEAKIAAGYKKRGRPRKVTA